MSRRGREAEDEDDDGDTRARVDKWLWAARFFKTRALAAEAVDGGKVEVNGARVKPARLLHVGDELKVRRSPFQWTLTVRDLNVRRGSATVAATLYEETPESRAAREALADQIRAQPRPGEFEKGRPTKKARRQIIRFTQGGD